MIVHKCEQYDPTWFKLRRGVPTASEFHRIVTPKKWEYASGVRSYICELIGQKYNPQYGYVEDYVSHAMNRGSQLEPEARLYYRFERGHEVTECGFITTDDGHFGYSPDGLVDPEGLLECKSPDIDTHIDWLLAGGIPDKHLGQCHGGLAVTDRDWIDFQSYCPGLPSLLVRLERDDKTLRLKAALHRFWDEYQEALAKVESMFGPPPTMKVDYGSLGTIEITPYDLLVPF